MKTPFLAIALASLAFSVQAANVAGTSSAVFNNPLTPNTVYSGVGTNSFDWGTALRGENKLTFTGTHFSAGLNKPFKLGSFSYTNGTTLSGTNPDSVDLTTFLNFSDAALPTMEASFRLDLTNTPNSRNARASADYVNFEQNTSSSQFIIGGMAYTVKISGFDHVRGAGFLSSNGTQFHVMEGHRASADVYGVVTAAPVPEAETWAMTLAGLGLLSLLARRRQKTRLH